MKTIKLNNTKIGHQNETHSFRVRNENKLENMVKKLIKQLGSFYSKFSIDYENKKISVFYFTSVSCRVTKTFKFEII